jgi:hypothetical protein
MDFMKLATEVRIIYTPGGFVWIGKLRVSQHNNEQKTKILQKDHIFIWSEKYGHQK